MKNSKKIFKKIIKNILKIVLILSLIYNIIFVIGHEYNSRFNIKIKNTQIIPVTEKSMEPEIKKNDIIIVKDIKEINENDIIVFYKNNGLKIKRIFKISKKNNEDFYTTKGDNNFFLDPGETSKKDIEGKVVGKIRFLGFIIIILQKKWLTIIITIVLILIMWYDRKMKKREERRKKLREIHNKNLELKNKK